MVRPGIRYILIATFFFMLMNVGVKLLDRIPVHEIVFFRALISLVTCYILVRRQGLNPWGKNKKYLILRGVAGTAALTMYFYTLHAMPLASAVTIQHLSPIFTIVIAGILLKEPPRPIQWLFFLVSFAGVLMIKGFDPRVTPLDLGIGISAAVCSGLAYNFIRRLRTSDHPLVVVLYFPMVTVPVIGSYSVFHWVTPTWLELAGLVALGLAVTVAQVYMTRAYQAEPAANISNFNYLSVVYAIILGWTFFAEPLTILASTGIILIVGGVILSTRYSRTVE